MSEGYEEVTDLKVKQLWVVMQNVLTAVGDKREFWIERRGDKVYLCWDEKKKEEKEPGEKDLIKLSLGFVTGSYIIATQYDKIPFSTSVTRLIKIYTKLEKEYEEKGETEIANTLKEEIEKLKKYLKVRK